MPKPAFQFAVVEMGERLALAQFLDLGRDAFPPLCRMVADRLYVVAHFLIALLAS